MPVLTLAQTRMMLLLGVSRGETLPHDPQQLAIAAGPGIAGCIGMGFGARGLVRRLPLSGPVVRAPWPTPAPRRSAPPVSASELPSAG